VTAERILPMVQKQIAARKAGSNNAVTAEGGSDVI
jgi:hypothetical protein